MRVSLGKAALCAGDWFSGIHGNRSNGDLFPIQQQFHYVTIGWLQLWFSVLLQHRGWTNTAIIDVDVISSLIMLHATARGGHGHMGMPRDENDIIMSVDDVLQLFVPTQIGLGVTALGVVSQ